MQIESIYRLSLQVLCKSGTSSDVYVKCVLDWYNTGDITENDGNVNASGVIDVSRDSAHPNSDGTTDGGNCPGFHVGCTSNLQTYINNGFAAAVTGQRIDDEDIVSFYNTAGQVAANRNFAGPPNPVGIGVNDGLVIDDNHHDVIKNWLDGTFGVDGAAAFGITEEENVGDIIDASGWISIRDKLKNVAKMCNDVLHCDCNKVCQCNHVCTCNCNSNY